MSKPENEDRRVKLTRQRLHEALLSLAIERGYDAITVQDVLERAQVARSTFYAHFRDKEDLLLSGFQDQGGALFCTSSAIEGGGVFTGLAMALFTHVYQNRAVANAFLGSPSSQMVFAHLRNMVVVEARKRLNEQATNMPSGIPSEIIVQYVAGTLFSLLTWWIDHSFPYTAQEMSEACESLLVDGLGATTLTRSYDKLMKKV